MAADNMKKSAVILALGGGKTAPEGGDDSLEMAASDLLDAIASKDAAGVAAAFRSMASLCDDYETEGGE